MANFAHLLDQALAPYHLLNHSFYNAWTQGKLTREIIKDYAAQYYHHVKAFPRYISAAHSVCVDIQNRKILLENLVDEENNGTDHPTLWEKFAEGMGNTKADLANSQMDKYTADLINCFFKYCRSSYPEGLASLYSYESQIPEIAKTKIEGLKKFYNTSSYDSLEFFYVHEKADIWHREQCQTLLANLNDADKESAKNAAIDTAKHLWNFLSGIEKKHNLA